MTKKMHDADVEFIKALAEVLAEKDLSELQVKREYPDDGSLDVRVTRFKEAKSAPVQYSSAPPPQPPATPAAPSSPTATETPANQSSGDPSADPGAVPSPMVGTVYLSPEPGADNFVKIGDKVSEGQTLLIVEAMKTMNQIPSPVAGTVKRLLVEDGAPVEFGAPLMIIE